MRTIACSILGLLMLCAGASAQSKTASADEAALRALEEKWDTANVKGDAAMLAELFADTFISTDADGKVRTKADILARMKSGELKYQSAKADDLKIFLHGDAAVVTGRWKGKFTEKGKAMDVTERFTDTFVRQNGRWRGISSHASTIK